MIDKQDFIDVLNEEKEKIDLIKKVYNKTVDLILTYDDRPMVYHETDALVYTLNVGFYVSVKIVCGRSYRVWVLHGGLHENKRVYSYKQLFFSIQELLAKANALTLAERQIKDIIE